MTTPRGGFINAEGKWDVENVGVSPDIEVEETPKDFAAGRDAQLERARAEAMKLMPQAPIARKVEPAPPVGARRRGSSDGPRRVARTLHGSSMVIPVSCCKRPEAPIVAPVRVDVQPHEAWTPQRAMFSLTPARAAEELR